MEVKHLALGMVNAYLIKNKNEYCLIDTGLAMGRSKLEQAFTQAGIKPSAIKLVIVTHADIDHIGNCAYLQSRFGLKIAVHESDVHLCRTGTINMNRKRKASKVKMIFLSLMFALIYKPMMKKHPLEAFEPDVILTDGQNLKKYGFDAKVIHIPGHTMGSLGILTGDGDFFSGDTINNRKKPTAADIIEDEDALESSLKRIKKLNIKTVYPGHGRPFPISELGF